MAEDEDGLEWALQARDQIRRGDLRNMGVTYSRGGEYTKSDDFQVPIPATTPPPEPSPMASPAPWLEDARADIGKYHDGPDVPMLAQQVAAVFPDQADYADEAGPSTSWCGIFVAAKLSKYGIRPPYLAPGNNVESWMYVDAWDDFGISVPIGQEQPGDLQIYHGAPHHINFADGNGWGIGGNQHDGVTRALFRTPDLIRRPMAPGAIPPSAPVGKRNMRITATVFTDPMGAYGPINHSLPIVSLPAPFPKPLPKVRVFGPKGSAVGQLADKGPWYDGTDEKPADRYWLTGSRPRAESDSHTNGAGIDLNPVLADLVGIDGKGLVDWEFVDDVVTPPPPPQPQTQPSPTDVARRLQEQVDVIVLRLSHIETDLNEWRATMPDPTPQPAPPQIDWTPLLQEIIKAIGPLLKQLLPMLIAAAGPLIKALVMQWLTGRLSAIAPAPPAPPATGFAIPQGTVTGILGLIGAIVSGLAPMLSQGAIGPEISVPAATISAGIGLAGAGQATKNALTKPKE